MITGATATCLVVADPVYQLRTPQALNRIWRGTRQDIIAVPAHVDPRHLQGFVSGLRANSSLVGAVVTVPHKQAMAWHCDELGANARLVGAVNVVMRSPEGRLIGETFDGLGFVEGLRAEGVRPEGRHAVVLGGGGAAAAVAAALVDAGVARLDVSNRTAAREEDLVARLRRGFPAADVGAGLGRLSTADLVVNATSAGLDPADDSPIASAAFPPGAIAADVVISTEATPFLAAAAAAGLRTHTGSHMLESQIRLIARYLDRSDAT